MFNPKFDTDYFNELSEAHFPAYLGITITLVEEGKIEAEMAIRKHLFAPNGFLHAGSIVSFADTIAGYSTLCHLPENATSFTTLELKSNFMRAARTGTIICESQPEHLGRTTQVWRVITRSKETGKQIAVFSCTQLVLY